MMIKSTKYFIGTHHGISTWNEILKYYAHYINYNFDTRF